MQGNNTETQAREIATDLFRTHGARAATLGENWLASRIHELLLDGVSAEIQRLDALASEAAGLLVNHLADEAADLTDDEIASRVHPNLRGFIVPIIREHVSEALTK
jgi:hypothetical protein